MVIEMTTNFQTMNHTSLVKRNRRKIQEVPKSPDSNSAAIEFVIKTISDLLKVKADLENKLSELRKVSDLKLRTLEAGLQSLSDSSTSMISRVEAEIKQAQQQQPRVGAAKDPRIDELQNLVKQHQDTIAKLQESVSNTKRSTHFGEPVSLPEQPKPQSEGGVWKSAPLSMSVNGGVVLHNIGFTKEKGLDLTLCPKTHRLLVHQSK